MAHVDRRRYDAFRLMSDDVPEPVEVVLGHLNGLLVEIMASPRQLQDLDGVLLGCLLVVTDVTARKRAEQRGRMLQDQLAHADRLKSMGELAAGLAHEINQPLGAIANFAEGCLSQLNGTAVQLQELHAPLVRIRQAALRGGEIIRRARRFS